ncbi:class I SAM-dependent methyltransferase [Brucella gallinifaecis]|uniref:Class I SAM-dependent methyltransferase n=1 Tax=Brucella gallinifaecis TaxID=215590 RepID=A0A502BTT3_9HYPH|nr:class I SAM-dependent methyltransferase [Brucella gallinifaecis]TPF76616.1 class I SAM-dependent methyltransferase [Brucella gallinifaecis]
MRTDHKQLRGMDHASLMDRVYKRQRHFYDATRKYYLLGRDTMIAGLNIPADGHVLEIGCGTGRNLVKTAQAYPDAKLFGIDISAQMLETAHDAAQRAGVAQRIRLEQADATHFDPGSLFGQNSFDRIFISYAISMIPQWQPVIAESIRHLKPGGELHIVDFGDQQKLPRWFKKALFTWLKWFHVTPRNDLLSVTGHMAQEQNASSTHKVLYRGFTWIVTIRSRPVTNSAM